MTEIAFSIKLLPEPAPDLDPGVVACLGLIKIGTFEERFAASLMYWNADDYISHWSQAVARIVHSSPTSCLITSIVDPANSKFLFWWPMYRIGKTVFIQNQILFLDQLKSSFNVQDPFIHVPDRKTINMEGQKISEWSTAIKDMEFFLGTQLRNP